MGFLKGKKILITGISSKRSVAFGIAKAMHSQKAELGFVCQNKKISNKIKYLVNSLNSNLIFTCDVSSDESIHQLFLDVSQKWNKFDGLIHSIAYCSKEQLNGDFINNITRQGFNTAHEITSYSFLALVKSFRKILNKFSSIITLSYLGSQRVVPNYNLMGLAKASLEANVRYLAYTLGKDKIRVNAISFNPIKTVSSYKIQNFNIIKNFHDSSSFIKDSITTKNVGNIAAFLSSNLSLGITGSIIYVDNGFNVSSKYSIF